jgi:hypothetical protein
MASRPGKAAKPATSRSLMTISLFALSPPGRLPVAHVGSRAHVMRIVPQLITGVDRVCSYPRTLRLAVLRK